MKLSPAIFGAVAAAVIVGVLFWLLWHWASVPWNRLFGVTAAVWLWSAGAVGGGFLGVLALPVWQPRPWAAVGAGAVALLVAAGALILFWNGVGCWETEISCPLPLELWVGMSPFAGLGGVAGTGYFVQVVARFRCASESGGGSF